MTRCYLLFLIYLNGFKETLNGPTPTAPPILISLDVLSVDATSPIIKSYPQKRQKDTKFT